MTYHLQEWDTGLMLLLGPLSTPAQWLVIRSSIWVSWHVLIGLGPYRENHLNSAFQGHPGSHTETPNQINPQATHVSFCRGILQVWE